MVSSFDSAFLPSDSSGLTARVTWGAWRRASTASATAALLAASVSLPFVALRTTGLVPFASLGRRASSRSSDFVESVPGRVRSSDVSDPATREVTTSTTVSAIQPPMTHQCRRAQNEAILCRTPVMNPSARGNYWAIRPQVLARLRCSPGER